MDYTDEEGGLYNPNRPGMDEEDEEDDMDIAKRLKQEEEIQDTNQ